MTTEKTTSENTGTTSSTDDIPTQRRVIEQQSGVKVEVKSVRGTGTRDQDTVTTRAYYDDIDEAYDSAESLATVTRKQMSEERKKDENGNTE